MATTAIDHEVRTEDMKYKVVTEYGSSCYATVGEACRFADTLDEEVEIISL
tara:strand:- start:247 stop:399 length:153 start_codon:yes stop_codon:yes gene_type:complete